ncbi:MAG: hypothetical protein JXM70_09480 [Pirellulales bacterium]|nr:hypothetical protein [Pirellulales bacterium]
MEFFPRLVLLGCVLASFVLPHSVVADNGTSEPVLTVIERTTQPLLEADRPWEDFCIGYCSVLRVGNDWHLWYDSYDRNYRDDNDCYSCYACSKDGVHWKKPPLGIYSYQGNKNNNIMGFGTHGVTVFLDEKAPTAERFKAVGVRQPKGKSAWWVYGATSPDGIHWKWHPEPLLKKNSDTADICIHDGDVYRLYARMWSGPKRFSGNRIIGYSQSPRFENFSDPVAILAADKDDPSNTQFYNPATSRISDDLYLMFPSGLMPDGSLPVYTAFSRDGKQFRRLARKPLLESGKGFDNKGIYVGSCAIPGEKPNTYWLYYLGTSVPHDDNLPTKVHGSGGIGRFLLKIGQ